jgi:hypothetical protein
MATKLFELRYYEDSEGLTSSRNEPLEATTADEAAEAAVNGFRSTEKRVDVIFTLTRD